MFPEQTIKQGDGKEKHSLTPLRENVCYAKMIHKRPKPGHSPKRNEFRNRAALRTGTIFRDRTMV